MSDAALYCGLRVGVESGWSEGGDVGKLRVARRVAGYVWRHSSIVAAADDAEVVLRRVHVVPEWREVTDGRARRLAPHETIDVTRVGRWERVDPRVVVTGWTRLRRGAGLLVWASAVGMAAWRGMTRGTGPLGVLGRD